SSRRRHTRFDCDWSSDVCSSDLDNKPARLGSSEIITDSCSAWAPSPTAPKPSSVGIPSAAVKFPSDPPPTAASSNFHPSSLATRSEEHTSELQSQSNLVCRLLLE